MSDYEKKRFNMMAESDKKRFDTEVEHIFSSFVYIS